MFTHKTVKKSLILLVAALLCVAVFLSACSEKPHQPVTKPATSAPESNGGIAVKYGDYIYYVNGYESSVNADNTYADTTETPRIGSVLRIKIEKLEEILGVHDKDELTSSQKTEEIAKLVRDYAEIVIPRIYYSANTTTARFNGIYIFNDRIYILTPNDQLTAGGNSQTNQLALMSYDLGGGDEQRHFTFTNNAAQIWLYQKDSAVMATYLMDSKLHVLKLGATEKQSVDTLITDGEDETVSTFFFDEAGQSMYYLNGDGSICKLAMGATEAEVIIDNSTAEGEDESTLTYTIKFVNNGYVYFTVADSQNSSLNNVVLYYVNTASKTEGKYEQKTALNSANVTATAWKENKVVIVRQNDKGYYGLYIIETAGETIGETCLLKPGYNKDSITINKIVGDDLYYTAGGVTYVKDLEHFESDKLGTPYATAMATSPTGWALPDLVQVTSGEKVTTYMFTLGTGSVTVVKFDPIEKKNSTSTLLTLTAASED